MHRSHGTFPVSGGRPPRCGLGAASAKGHASSGLPATPEALPLTEAFCAGVRHSPRFATAPATPPNDGDDEDRGGESQPLLSPPCLCCGHDVCVQLGAGDTVHVFELEAYAVSEGGVQCPRASPMPGCVGMPGGL